MNARKNRPNCFILLSAAERRGIVQGQMYPIPQNLAPNVNLSYCMDLWTLGSKLLTTKLLITKIVTFS